MENMLKNLTTTCSSMLPNMVVVNKFFKCNFYPKSDPKYLERCQMQGQLPMFPVFFIFWKSNLMFLFVIFCMMVVINSLALQIDCYIWECESYIGGVDWTGVKCEYWSIANLFLSQPVYPIQLKNECRNPQGYLSQLWCHTNARTRQWNCCSILECQNRRDGSNTFCENSSKLERYFSIISLYTAIRFPATQSKDKFRF